MRWCNSTLFQSGSVPRLQGIYLILGDNRLWLTGKIQTGDSGNNFWSLSLNLLFWRSGQRASPIGKTGWPGSPLHWARSHCYWGLPSPAARWHIASNPSRSWSYYRQGNWFKSYVCWAFGLKPQYPQIIASARAILNASIRWYSGFQG